MSPAVEALNQAGQTWWIYAFHTTWTSSLVAVLLLAVIWLGWRWPAQLRYTIVLIALLKFAVPPMLALPVGLFSHLGPTIIEEVQPATAATTPTDSDFGNSPFQAVVPAWGQLEWAARLMLLHLIGCVVAGGLTVSRLAKLHRMARRAEHLDTGRWHELFSRLAGMLGLKRTVLLLRSDEAVPPMAFWPVPAVRDGAHGCPARPGSPAGSDDSGSRIGSPSSGGPLGQLTPDIPEHSLVVQSSSALGQLRTSPFARGLLRRHVALPKSDHRQHLLPGTDSDCFQSPPNCHA